VRFISFFVDDFFTLAILIESTSNCFREVFTSESLRNFLLFKTMRMFTLQKSTSLRLMREIAEIDFEINFHPSSDII